MLILMDFLSYLAGYTAGAGVGAGYVTQAPTCL